jgi:hypothetical protein
MSATVAVKKVEMNDSSKSRLEKARLQYESLLLHAGNTLLAATTPPRSLSNSPEMLKSAIKTPSSGDSKYTSPFPNLFQKDNSPQSLKGKYILFSLST